MDDKLLAGGDAGSYGSRGHQPESPAKDREEGGGDGGGWTWTKRLRRQRRPSFGAADDERAAAETAGASGECRASTRGAIKKFCNFLSWSTRRPKLMVE